MGLLDDAIREHLELKRRRGGDPSEIERAEREALGPVRRMPEPGEGADFDGPYDDAAPDEELGHADEREDSDAYPLIGDTPLSHRVAPDDDAEFFDRPPVAPAEAFGHETAEYDLEPPVQSGQSGRGASHPPETAGGTAEDPLEETPEFLQDTPDHDRLWFEQRPPRDFKFDG